MTQHHAYVGLTFRQPVESSVISGALLVVSLADPAEPEFIFELDTEGIAALRICGPHLVTVGRSQGRLVGSYERRLWDDGLLSVWDISEPERPQRARTLSLDSPYGGLAVLAGSTLACAGDYAYVNGGLWDAWVGWPEYRGGVLLVIDLSDPAHLMRIAARWMSCGVEAIGAHVYVCGAVYELSWARRFHTHLPLVR